MKNLIFTNGRHLLDNIEKYHFDELFGNMNNMFPRNIIPESSIYVYEKDDKKYIECDLPGVDKKDISIKFVDDNKSSYLEITAKRYSNEKVIKDYREIVNISSKYDPSTFSAKYDNGVLTLVVNKIVVKSNDFDIKIT